MRKSEAHEDILIGLSWNTLYLEPEAMENGGEAEITQLLERARGGDSRAESALIEMVYPELRRMAASYLRRERQGHTLQPTALVHEVFLRLTPKSMEDLKNRAHFFAVCAHLMRQILVDSARSRRSVKRGGGAMHVPLEDWVAIDRNITDLVLAVDEVLQKLEKLDPRQARVVELKYFADLSEEEIAEVMGSTPRTVRRDWASAKAWLQKTLSGQTADNDR